MYLEIDEGFPGHRKTLRLCSLLKNPEAGWYMIRLWTWACRSCPTGILIGLTPYDIEMAVQYRPLDGECYTAMVKAGFIDVDEQGPSGIHDWMDYTGGAIKRMDDTAERKKLWRAHRDHKCRRGCEFCKSEKSRGQKEDVNATSQRQDGDEDKPTQTRQDKTSPDQSSPDQSSKDPDQDQRDICAEPASAAPALVTFPCSGSPNSWDMTESNRAEWALAYPAVDVLGEARQALAWINANPTKRKTSRGMARFLVSWMARCQNRGGSSKPFLRPQGHDPSRGHFAATTAEPPQTGRREMP